jgi:hypothetical protein
MNRRDLSILGWAALALLCAACATPQSAPICSQPPGLVSAEGDPQMNTVGIVDESLAKGGPIRGGGRIAIAATNARRTPSGTLEAWAHVRNCTTQALQIEARALFYDADQYPVEEPTAWTRLFVPKNSSVAYKALSANDSRVTYYYLELREAR